MLWLVVALLWVLFLAAFARCIRRPFARLRARREEIGDRQIPRRKQLRTIALCVFGGMAAMGVAVIAGLGAIGVLLGSIVLAMLFSGVVYLTIRDADEAQAG
jgi:hypothetical protein